MQKQLIATIVGLDQPGLVERLAQAVHSAGGNWLASNFSQLAGQFAGILQVTVDPARYQALAEALKNIPQLHITLADGSDAPALTTSRRAKVELTANDRTGIVNEISQLLSQYQVNIEHLETHCDSAPNWGSPLFRAQLELSLPADLSEEQLATVLESLADDLIVDMQFS